MKLSKLILLFALFTNYCFAQEWEQVSSMPEDFITHHAFAFSIDDMGYIVTGSTIQGMRKDFYRYDPSTDEWTRLDDYPGPRRSFGIGDVYEGKAYLGFGTDGSADLNDLWSFDPATNEWTELASCPCLRRTHPAMVAHNGKIYVGLGGTSLGNSKDWWAYDIASDTWEQKADFPSSRRHHPFQFAIGDYVYVGFGHGVSIYNRWYRYDPSDDTWMEVAQLPAEGRVAGTQFSNNGKGYVLSGDGETHSSMDEGEFWSFDPVANVWEQLPSHPGKSRWAPSSFVIDDHVYIINGQVYSPITGEQYVTEIYRYDLNAEPTSINAAVTFEPIKVYPNPTNASIFLEELEVDEDNFNIKIYNTNAQVVYQKSTYEQELNLAKLPVGMYWIEIINGDQTYRQLVTKQ